MSNLVENSTTLKGVRISQELWASVSIEKVARETTITNLIAVAWQHFISLDEHRREKLVRDFERADNTNAA